jgi:acetyl esterase
MKAWKIILIVVAALVAALFIVVNAWCATPYGRLDWRTAVLLKYINASNIPMFREGSSADESRLTARNRSRILKGRPPALPVVVDRTIPGPGGEIPVRIYAPIRDAGMPVVVYCHGGGWVLSDLDTHDVVCRKLALASSSIVVSVDYRLAPEHPFPAAVDDAYAAVLWVGGNAESFGGDPSRIAVAGDSAGGNLAAVVAQLARDRKGPRLAAQVLFYPAVDLSRLDTQSYKDFATGYYLTRELIEAFRVRYAPNPEDWKSPLVSPILASSLKDLPPAVVVTEQFDPLRDEGEAYAARLKAEGVPVVQKRYAGILHGFLTLDRLLPQADAAIRLAGTELKRLFSVKGD